MRLPPVPVDIWVTPGYEVATRVPVGGVVIQGYEVRFPGVLHILVPHDQGMLMLF